MNISKSIKYGEPWKLNPEATAIGIPILTTKVYRGPRNYRLYSEIEGEVHVEDTGNINVVKIVNNSKTNVFFKKGLIIKGGTQTRSFINSVMVGPNSTKTANIRCVYASKGISRGAKFSLGGYAPEKVLHSLHAGQGETWDSVKAYTSGHTDSDDSINTDGTHETVEVQATKRPRAIRSRSQLIGATMQYRDSGVRALSADLLDNVGFLMTNSSSDSWLNMGTDDLLGSLEDSGDEIEQALTNLPPNHEKQVGIAIVDEYGVRAFEIFDRPDAWEALSSVVVKNYANILNNAKKNGKEVDVDVAHSLLDDFIRYIEDLNYRLHTGTEKNGTYICNNRMVAAEYNTLSHIVHVLVNRLQNKSFQSFAPLVKKVKEPVYRKEDNKAPLDEQMEAAFKINFLSKKRGFETTAAIADGHKTFGNIQKSTRMSTKSVSEALQEGVELGLIYKTGNQYELTEEGVSLNPQKFKKAFGR